MSRIPKMREVGAIVECSVQPRRLAELTDIGPKTLESALAEGWLKEADERRGDGASYIATAQGQAAAQRRFPHLLQP
jgi:hypothetical protein